MRKRLFLVLSLLAVLVTSCGSASHDGLTASAQPVTPAALDAAALRTQIETLHKNSKVKATLATVRVGERDVLTLGLGESMTGVPATPDMTVRLGGISQTYIGTLLMLLVERGDIALDDKISKWMPDLLESENVTVRMLIKHTSGYKDFVQNEEWANLATAEPFRHFTRAEMINYAVGSGEMDFAPGTKQRYCHTNYTILANAMEAASGNTMDQLFSELIFTPLQLKRTGYNTTAELPSPVLHAFVSARGVYEESTFYDPSWTAESGPLYSNLLELGPWLRLHGTGALLTPASFQELIAKPDVATQPGGYIASGFIVSNGWYFQNPSFNGFSGAYGYNPAHDITIAIFTTQSQDPTSDAQAYQMLRDLVSTVTPDSPLPAL